LWQTSGLENAVGAEHIRGMVCLDEYLTADEFNALEEVDEGRNRPIFKRPPKAFGPPLRAKCDWR
jgi:hypothetical protein